MQSFTLPLSTPVKLTESSPEVKELVIRRPFAKDLKGMPGELTQDDNMLALSRITDTPLAVIEKLDGHDYMKAVGVLQVFLANGPETGIKLSAK
jgi:hypothetical protein